MAWDSELPCSTISGAPYPGVMPYIVSRRDLMADVFLSESRLIAIQMSCETLVADIGNRVNRVVNPGGLTFDSRYQPRRPVDVSISV